MTILIVVLLLLLLFGGGWFGYRRYDAPGLVGTVVLVLLIAFLLRVLGVL